MLNCFEKSYKKVCIFYHFSKLKWLSTINITYDTNLMPYSITILHADNNIHDLMTGPYWLQYIPRNMHTVFALLCFVVVIHWLIFPYPSGLLHWHCGNLTIAPVPAKQPWWIWINTSCEFIMNDCITTTKQSTTKPCAYFVGYTVCSLAKNTAKAHYSIGKGMTLKSITCSINN